MRISSVVAIQLPCEEIFTAKMFKTDRFTCIFEVTMNFFQFFRAKVRLISASLAIVFFSRCSSTLMAL